jgi:hypothetical protein
MDDLRNDLAKARDAWMGSLEGQSCSSGQAQGKYLMNRLELAFIAGWHAKESPPPSIPEKAE